MEHFEILSSIHDEAFICMFDENISEDEVEEKCHPMDMDSGDSDMDENPAQNSSNFFTFFQEWNPSQESCPKITILGMNIVLVY